MILTCPACTTRYQTDAAKFPPAGRQVRCAKCGHVWHQAGAVPPPGETAAAVIAATPLSSSGAPEDEPVSRLRGFGQTPQPEAPRRALLPLLGVTLGWIGLIALVLGIGYSAVRYRQEVAILWPQSAGVYSGLGMKVDTHGIDFGPVSYRRESQDGQAVLAVNGTLVNRGARELPVAQILRVTLSDGHFHELYHWNFAPGITTLKPGQSAPFHTRLANPPVAARHLEVRFARDDK